MHVHFLEIGISHQHPGATSDDPDAIDVMSSKMMKIKMTPSTIAAMTTRTTMRTVRRLMTVSMKVMMKVMMKTQALMTYK